jgi:hypothetical protein
MEQQDVGDILDFKKKVDPKVMELFTIGTNIDAMVISAVQNGFVLFEVSAIISHRLGECIKNLPAKEQQADILFDIIIKRAEL